jgi:hypothetical protein
MAYLTLVFKTLEVSDFCDPEIVQKVVKNLCMGIKTSGYIASFEIKQSWTQRLIAWLHDYNNLAKFEYH